MLSPFTVIVLFIFYLIYPASNPDEGYCQPILQIRKLTCRKVK